MRGYFGIGAEKISKAMNLGAVLRTGNAFGASFAFTVGAHHRAREVALSDTAKSDIHMPLYEWASLEEMRLPKGCSLVGVELDPRAIDLPTFRHPLQAAYILGPEKGNLSDEAKALCTHIVKIPTRFCVNLSVAAAIVMYDRTLNLGGWPPRPITEGGPPDAEKWEAPRARRATRQ
ncbi:MAG TPA: RNA methyltransferase [Amphiplicatus sp.]|nr:RNA methyltransferase [Caulobacterales bacterium]HOP19224.1 RNA methyltransferase [Amphiplicatus sp.]